MVWRRRRARVEPDHVDLEHWVNGPVATAPSVLSEPTARTGASSYRSPWLGLPNVKPEVRRRAVPSGRSRVRATTPCRRPLRNHRPPLECARHRACARSAAPRRCRPFPCVLALGRCGLPRQPLSPLRSLQRAARHLVELLAGRLPHPRGVEGRRDATARERSPVDRCKAADLARRPELGKRSLGMASVAPAGSGAATRRLSARLRRKRMRRRTLLELDHWQGCKAGSGRHGRDRRRGLHTPLHRSVYVVGRRAFEVRP
jgi:hypothetical protein